MDLNNDPSPPRTRLCRGGLLALWDPVPTRASTDSLQPRRAREGSCKQPESRLPNRAFSQGQCSLSLGHQATELPSSEFRALLPAIFQAYDEAARLSVDRDGRVCLVAVWAVTSVVCGRQPLTSGSMLSCSPGAWVSGGGMVMERLGGFRLCRRLPDTDGRLLPFLSAEAMAVTMLEERTARASRGA